LPSAIQLVIIAIIFEECHFLRFRFSAVDASETIISPMDLKSPHWESAIAWKENNAAMVKIMSFTSRTSIVCFLHAPALLNHELPRAKHIKSMYHA
jgi:hypothetical protein